MRLAISISPSRVSSSTEPISRMYMRTGSVVRPNSESTVDSAASACSSTSSSGCGHRLGVGGDEQRLLVGRLVVDLDAHVAEGGDDGFDLLGIDQIVGQVVVDLGVGEEAALLAELDQVLETRAARLGVFLRQLRRDQPRVLAAAAPAAPALALGLDLGDFALRGARAPALALVLMGALALPAGAGTAPLAAAFGATTLRAFASSERATARVSARVLVRVSLWRATFFAAGRAARPFSFRRLTAPAFFFAACTFLTLLRLLTIKPPLTR